MKKIIISVIAIASVCVLLCLIFLDYFAITSPQLYTIYINDEKAEDICAYWYQGHMYVPVIGIMEACGYEVNRIPGQNPSFTIDGEVYQLNMEECTISNGMKEYLRENMGVRWSIHVDGEDAYVLFAEVQCFFEKIGKEQQIGGSDRNYLLRHVKYSIDKAS